MAQGMRQGTSAAPPNSAGNELEKEGAAWIAGKDTLPQFALSVKPKQEATAFQVKDFSSLQMFGYIVPTYCNAKKKQQGKRIREERKRKTKEQRERENSV